MFVLPGLMRSSVLGGLRQCGAGGPAILTRVQRFANPSPSGGRRAKRGTGHRCEERGDEVKRGRSIEEESREDVWGGEREGGLRHSFSSCFHICSSFSSIP